MAKPPKPFTPPDCDLRGLPFMPLHGDRLIDSDLFFMTTGDEFKAALALWWASWKQIPAASLPAEPRVLAGLARIHDLKQWEKVHERALHGWVKCSDGRLYHRVVADLALEAWEERQEHRQNRESETERKRREREERKGLFAALKVIGVHLPWNTQLADLRKKAADAGVQPVQNLSAGQPADRPAPVPAIEGTGTGTGTKRKPPKPPEGAFDPIFDQAWQAYPDTTTSNRARSLAAWTGPAAELGAEDLLGRVKAYALHQLAAGPKAKAPPAFHRWLADRRFETFAPAAGAIARTWQGPQDVWDAVAALPRSPAYAKSWLSACSWQEAPIKAVISSSPTAAKKLREDVGPILDSMGIQILERAA